MLRKLVCLALILMQLGCRSVYRFECRSHPSEAGVVIAEEMVGETPCQVGVPRDSEWIQDGKIEFTFCLPDGREKKRVVDLRGFKPSNPLAEVVAAPFLLVGGGLLILAAVHDNEKDDERPRFGDDDRDKDKGDNLVTGLAGIGVMAIGAGVYGLFGGKSESLGAHKVLVYFDEPEGADQASPAAESND